MGFSFRGGSCQSSSILLPTSNECEDNIGIGTAGECSHAQIKGLTNKLAAFGSRDEKMLCVSPPERDVEGDGSDDDSYETKKATDQTTRTRTHSCPVHHGHHEVRYWIRFSRDEQSCSEYRFVNHVRGTATTVI